MENHPIPQDVTSFQFKLIGNMTVKQFAYLATGTVLAVILLQLPVNFFIKFPFCAFFALLGIGLAYLPVGGRPMDSMIGYYIKALTRPTVFVYDKTGYQVHPPDKTPTTITKNLGQLTNDLNPFPKDQLKDYLKTFAAKPKDNLDEKEGNFLMSISDLAANSPPVYQFKNIPNLDLQQVELQINLQPNLAGPSDLSSQLSKSEQIPPQQVKIAPPSPTIPLSKPGTPQSIPVSPLQTMPARPAQKGLNKFIGMPSISTSPNMITGITKDPRGNALSNILIEVKDKDGNPIRAFKTNGIGRFASATPLINGIYTVEFKDPRAQNKFENMTINISGQVIPPIEAVSIDTREELRRSLFASSAPASGDL